MHTPAGADAYTYVSKADRESRESLKAGLEVSQSHMEALPSPSPGRDQPSHFTNEGNESCEDLWLPWDHTAT